MWCTWTSLNLSTVLQYAETSPLMEGLGGLIGAAAVGACCRFTALLVGFVSAPMRLADDSWW